MLQEESVETKKLAEQNAALIGLLGKIHAMLKPYKGRDDLNGQLFRVLDLELFRAKNMRPTRVASTITVTIHAESSAQRKTKIKPLSARVSR